MKLPLEKSKGPWKKGKGMSGSTISQREYKKWEKEDDKYNKENPTSQKEKKKYQDNFAKQMAAARKASFKEFNARYKKSAIAMPVEKSDGGGIGGMTTTSGGAGVITIGQGSYPGFRKKKKIEKKKSTIAMPIEKSKDEYCVAIDNRKSNKKAIVKPKYKLTDKGKKNKLGKPDRMVEALEIDAQGGGV